MRAAESVTKNDKSLIYIYISNARTGYILVGLYLKKKKQE